MVAAAAVLYFLGVSFFKYFVLIYVKELDSAVGAQRYCYN